MNTRDDQMLVWLPSPVGERDPRVIFRERGVQAAFVEMELLIRNSRRFAAYRAGIRALHDCSELSDKEIEDTISEVVDHGLVRSNGGSSDELLLNKNVDPFIVQRFLQSPDLLVYLWASVASSDSTHWKDRELADILAQAAATSIEAKWKVETSEDVPVADPVRDRAHAKRETTSGSVAAGDKPLKVYWQIAAALIALTFCGAGYGVVAEWRRLNNQIERLNLRAAIRSTGFNVTPNRQLIFSGFADSRYISHVDVSVTRPDGETTNERISLAPDTIDYPVEWRSQPLPNGKSTVLIVFRPHDVFNALTNPDALFQAEGYFSKERTHIEQSFRVGPSGVVMLSQDIGISFVDVPASVRLKSQQLYEVDVETSVAGTVAVFVRADGALYWTKQNPSEFQAGQRTGVTCYFGRGGESVDEMEFHLVAQLYKEGTDVPTDVHFVNLPSSDFQSETHVLTVEFAE